MEPSTLNNKPCTLNQAIYDVMMPILKCLRIPESTTPTGGRLVHKMTLIGRELEDLALLKPTAFGGMYMLAWEAWQKRWEDLKNPIIAVQYAFDQEHRGQQLHMRDVDYAWMKSCIGTMTDKVFKRDSDTARTNMRVLVMTQWVQFSSQTGPYKQFSGAGNNHKTQMWREAPLMTMPLFWRVHGHASTKEMNKLAMTCGVQGQAASPCERNWSWRARIHTVVRNRLDSEKVTKLLFVAEWEKAKYTRALNTKAWARYFRFVDVVASADPNVALLEEPPAEDVGQDDMEVDAVDMESLLDEEMGQE